MSDYSYHGSVVITLGHHSELEPIAVFTHLEIAHAWVREFLKAAQEDIVAWPMAINPEHDDITPEGTSPDACWSWEAGDWVEYRGDGPWNGYRVP
jgi:hypothetical protein